MSTHTVEINGTRRDVPAHATMIDVVQMVTGHNFDANGRPTDGGRVGVAVAINGQVVPRSKWRDTRVSASDQVEIVGAVQGG